MSELDREESVFRIRQRGELSIECDVCHAPPGATCTPPALDCGCPTCDQILKHIHAGHHRGCGGGRREHAGKIFEQDPTIPVLELLELATRETDAERKRSDERFAEWERRRTKMLATRAANAAARAAGQLPAPRSRRSRA